MNFTLNRICALILCCCCYSTICCQLLFNENAIGLGCDNTSYGNGLLGGGISFFDFDQDGWDDITVSSEVGSPIRFFRNNKGFFSEIFLLDAALLYETKTVQWVDFDNDSDYDLFVTSNIQQNTLYENRGNLDLEDITGSAGLLTTDHRTFGASWGDVNNDGWLDVFLSSRHLDDLSISNLLFVNNGDATFTNATATAGILDSNFYSFCASFIDYNKDGWQDIYIANDKDPNNQMYHNNGDGTFTEVGTDIGVGIAINAMSTAIGDSNSDGWLDIYVTNTPEGNAFFMNEGGESFNDVAPFNGTFFESVSWGAVFLDGENDGDLDLYVSGMLDGSSGQLPSAFYENDGNGVFSIPSNAGFENDTAESYGNAIGDVNNDGFPDIVVLNYQPDPIFIFENQSNVNNNWLKVNLQGVESNRQGIGSWIEISVNGEKQYNYTLCGEGYLGQNSGYEFFGIGSASQIDYVKVTWLSGTVDIIENPNINSSVTLVEGSTLGILDTNQLKASVAPNPSEGIFTLRVPNTYVGNSVSLVDVMGRILETFKISNTNFNLLETELAPGVYTLNITSPSVSVSKKILIEK